MFLPSVSTTYLCCQNKNSKHFILGLCLFLNLYWPPWYFGGGQLDGPPISFRFLWDFVCVFRMNSSTLFGFCRPHIFHNWRPDQLWRIQIQLETFFFASLSVARIMTENCVAYSCSWPEGKSTLPIHANCEQWMIFCRHSCLCCYSSKHLYAPSQTSRRLPLTWDVTKLSCDEIVCIIWRTPKKRSISVDVVGKETGCVD